MQKLDASSQTDLTVILPEIGRHEYLKEAVRPLEMSQLDLLRAFFLILDEWDRREPSAN